jgi:hypothetical protein
MSEERLLYADGCPGSQAIDFKPEMVRKGTTSVEHQCQTTGRAVDIEVSPGGPMVISVNCLQKPCRLAKAR